MLIAIALGTILNPLNSSMVVLAKVATVLLIASAITRGGESREVRQVEAGA